MNRTIPIIIYILIVLCYTHGGYIEHADGSYLCWTSGCDEMKSKNKGEKP